jgi:ubiquinone/menaquinone biosynthesis C-methylase UbiE
MDGAQSKNTFKPKQALAPTPQLYDELVGDSMANLAKASLAQIPPIAAGSVVHDIGCGTGASTVAIVDAISGPKAEVTIKGTDINDQALEVYKNCIVANKWPAEAVKMDAAKLTFEDDTFSLALGNAFLFILPNDGIDAVKEMYRTLKPGGSSKSHQLHCLCRS